MSLTNQKPQPLCGVVELQITYKSIEKLSFEFLSSKAINNQSVFQISFLLKYETLPEEKDKIIISRKIEDFQWLIQSFRSNFSHFVILPHLEQIGSDSKSFIRHLISSRNIQDEDMVFSKRLFQQKIVKRFFQILCTISHPFLISSKEYKQNPLFIFFQREEDYCFFKSLYEQQKQLHITSGLISGYFKTVFEYFPFGKKKTNDIEGLSPIKQEIQSIHQKGLKLHKKLENYKSQLEKAQQNFINEKQREQIKNKQKKVGKFMSRIQQNLRYAQIVLNEIARNMENLLNFGEKTHEQTEKFVEMMKNYKEYVTKQRNEIKKAIGKIGREFQEQNMKEQERIFISIGQIYHNYKA